MQCLLTDATETKKYGMLQSPGKEREGEVCPVCWNPVGAPADATHDTPHILWSYVWPHWLHWFRRIIHDRAITLSKGQAPSSLLLHWIIPAPSSVISLKHHLCMLFLGYYLWESRSRGKHGPSFTFPAGETQPCWQIMPTTHWMGSMSLEHRQWTLIQSSLKWMCRTIRGGIWRIVWSKANTHCSTFVGDDLWHARWQSAIVILFVIYQLLL